MSVSTEDTLAAWRTAGQVWLNDITTDDVPGPAAHCGRCKFQILCYACCIMDHRRTPLHFLKEWTGVFWQKTTLAQVGFVYQVGHDGLDCNLPLKDVHSTRVLHTTGIQTLYYQLCGCEGAPGLTEQLAVAGLLVASAMDASTAATPSLLDMFASLRLE
ncbi:hypothetical protein C8R43DRAFT_1116266 [Mycena crocata]|nr:hypothetical protein C8R43DRAFT_1116266 [Mycena crocata]